MSSGCTDQAAEAGAQLWPRRVECVWRFSLQQDAHTGGMSIPFVDPWERSSISLLGTALMRPGILPFIRHSLQLGTARSFSLWPRRSVCIHRHNAAGHGCPLLPSARAVPSRAAPVHTRHPAPSPTVYLESRTCNHFPQAVLQQPSSWMLFVRAPPCPPPHLTRPPASLRPAPPPSRKSQSPARVRQERSYGRDLQDLADMECITFPEFREERQTFNANQIYSAAIFIQTSIQDRGAPRDPP